MNRLRTSFALVALLVSVGQASGAEPLRIAASPWPPYTGEELPGNGLAIRIVTEAFKRAGYATTVAIESWPRTLEGVDIGVYDVIAAAWYSPDRAQRFAFTEPYLTNRMRLVGRRDRPLNIASLADLAGLKVAVVRDYAYGEEFDRATHFTKVPQNHLVQGLLLLVGGQVDLVAGDEFAIRHELKEYMPAQSETLQLLPKAMAFKSLHAAVSRDNPKHQQIVSDFNKSLAAMNADGTLRAIMDEYLKAFEER